VESIIGKNVQEIRNFVDRLIKEPLNYFVSNDEVRPQDYITRLPYPGRIQGYYVKSYAIDLSYLIKRLAYTKELYVLVEGEGESKDIEYYIQLLLPNLQLTTTTTREEDIIFKNEVKQFDLLPYIQLFTVKKEKPYILLRLIPLHTIYEASNFIFELAYKLQHIDRMFKESIEHIKGGIYHPFSPSSARWHKGISDFIDERAAPQLYFTHYMFGIRGKFFPRMVSALINAVKVNEGEWLLDPFCGCGTMNLEATIKGINNIGIDMQPLFTMITELKIKSLKWDIALLKEKINELLNNIKIAMSTKDPNSLSRYIVEEEGEGERNTAKAYLPDSLMKGVSKDSLETVGMIKGCIENIDVNADHEVKNDFKRFFKLPLAYWMRSMLKKQTPEKIFETYSEYLWKMYFSIYYFNKFNKEIYKFKLGESRIYTHDVRTLYKIEDEILTKKGVDSIITSPPYGTAIDYIGEHVWALYILDLVKNHLELDREAHIGTSRVNKEELAKEIIEKDKKFTSLPELAKVALIEMVKRKEIRRKAAAFYKYFVDMTKAFEQMTEVLKRDKYLVMIIGKEQETTITTSAGSFKVKIELGRIMEEIGKSVGLEHVQSVDIALQKASELGAIPTEHIIIFKKL
ncbi:MAG: hypothetical protein QXI92_01965, partial [Candidatus Nitrosocaldus sp.]